MPEVFPQVNIDRVKLAGRRGFFGLLLVLAGLLIPFVGVVLEVLGLVTQLLAFNALSQELQEPKIFRYALYAVILGIADSIVGTLVIVYTGAVFLYPQPVLQALLAGSPAYTDIAIGAPAAAYVITVAIGYLYKKVYAMLAEGMAVLSEGASDDFRSASKWYWIGSLLLIVVVGAVLLLVAMARAMHGFRYLYKEGPSNQLEIGAAATL